MGLREAILSFGVSSKT